MEERQRQAAPAEPPVLSVVIASRNPSAVILECLEAVGRQAARDVVEIIVADSSSDGTPELIRQRFPEVTLLRVPEPASIPRLRGEGIAAARGGLIALLDPFCIVGDEWITEVLKAHCRRSPVIGGAVALDSNGNGLVQWSTYLSEYAEFAPPVRDGPVSALTGNNIVYKRRMLADGEALRRAGFWKPFVNWQLQAEGHELWSCPSLIVRLRKPIPFAEFFRSRYHHGRSFAAMRVTKASRALRTLRALTTPLLPWLALWRRGRSIWPKRAYRGAFLKTIPIVFLYDTSWAWGELWGYLRGPGRSYGQLRY